MQSDAAQNPSPPGSRPAGNPVPISGGPHPNGGSAVFHVVGADGIHRVFIPVAAPVVQSSDGGPPMDVAKIDERLRGVELALARVTERLEHVPTTNKVLGIVGGAAVILFAALWSLMNFGLKPFIDASVITAVKTTAAEVRASVQASPVPASPGSGASSPSSPRVPEGSSPPTP